ncbi:transposase [Sporosarcina sp. Marseille-Q4063]|nr:transposase [Sporosarcina sp. Marseille-Q4063]
MRCPKFRFHVLIGEIEERLRRILFEKSNTYKIIELEIMPDHIHVFVSVKPYNCPHVDSKNLQKHLKQSCFSGSTLNFRGFTEEVVLFGVKDTLSVQ